MFRLSETLSSKLSWIGFVFAVASGLLAIYSIFIAWAISGSPFYDPSQLRIFAWGLSLSFVGLAFAIVGALRPSSRRLRFIAVGCASVTLMCWFLSAMGE
jgi:hypothetical protein